MASQYLSSQTEALESQDPVKPEQARAAQIPLQTFHLPTFPPESFAPSSNNLTSLILTSDINPVDYTTHLTNPLPSTPVPPLPPTITSLTLELFSLGYPPGFLTALAAQLKAVNALTLYSQLFAGTSRECENDALAFISSLSSNPNLTLKSGKDKDKDKDKNEVGKGLRELHLLDTFFPESFLHSFSHALSASKELEFLEVGYTYRHSDPTFLEKVRGKEVLGLLEGRKGLVGLSMTIGAPDVVVEDDNDREGTEEGVLVISGLGNEVLGKLVGGQIGEGAGAGGDLVMCDVSMFELSVDEIGKLLDGCEKVKVLGVSVGLGEGGWEKVLLKLGEKGREVEVLEIVGVPGRELVERIEGGGDVGMSRGGVEGLGMKWGALRSLKGSVLRTKGEEWMRGDDGVWVKRG